ncbi:MAG: NADH-quinone oxidoreductase subunit H [Sandaracinaceae bacterium]|nr:NADH-quinone oxidoreductase subunit H [Sandaracinaceae bacterium]
MTTGLLLLTTALKILFILLVTVGAFAPMLVWAERRQSAMMQDRIGPHRAGIMLPRGTAEMLGATVAPMRFRAPVPAVPSGPWCSSCSRAPGPSTTPNWCRASASCSSSRWAWACWCWAASWTWAPRSTACWRPTAATSRSRVCCTPWPMP